VPERVWALRNIAATMALSDRRAREKARDMFQLALSLQREHLAHEEHPGLLGELWRCAPCAGGCLLDVWHGSLAC
jgi:hypothetical protein